MDSITKFIVGVILLLAFDVLLWSTVVFFVRRWKRIDPAWSWARTLGAVSLLALLVTGVGLVPVIGRFAAVIVSLVGVKRITGLDVLSSIIVSLCIGSSVFVVAVVLSRQLHMAVIGLP